MSKKSKSAAKERRKSLKRTRKLAEQARYEGYMKAGNNSSKRSKLRNKRSSGQVRSVRHKEGDCGNIGCSRCCGANHNIYTPRVLWAMNKGCM